MFDHKVSHFEQKVTTIHPGEYLVSDDDIIISTVLGSCVAVCLWDSEKAYGGVNHFLLPGSAATLDYIKNRPSFASDTARYGMYAMELLVNELLKKGSRKENLRAKVFGGAVMFKYNSRQAKSISQANGEFALQYLKTEKINIAASDLGGVQARKIFFFVRSGKVFLKRIHGTLQLLIEKEEKRYLEHISSHKKEGDIILFDS